MEPEKVAQLFPVSKIFLNPHVLELVSRLENDEWKDSKWFVDLEFKDESQIERCLDEFGSLGTNFVADDFIALVSKYFESPKPLEAVPHSIDENGGQSPSIRSLHSHDESIQCWIRYLNQTWSRLKRKSDSSARPRCSTLIPLPYPFTVPGGRFHEVYYWDSYWILKGLLVCGRLREAEDIVRNLLHLVERFGFVPNGNRIYYLNRSQPPMLSLMVYELFKHMDNAGDMLVYAIPLLVKEYSFFEQRRKVGLDSESRERYELNWYVVDGAQTPRPESFRDDSQVARSCFELEAKKTPAFYRNICSAAESGWDFSSRWLDDGMISTIQDTKSETAELPELPCSRYSLISHMDNTNIAPVCLNSILLRVEQCILELCQMAMQNSPDDTTGQFEQLCQDFGNRHHLRQVAMHKLMWDESSLQWLDLNARPCRQRKLITSVSNFLPLWASDFSPFREGTSWNESKIIRTVQEFRSSGLMGPGGLYTTTLYSGEQWDFPNCWPPLVEMIVEGFELLASKLKSGDPKLEECVQLLEQTASEIATNFLANTFAGWRATGLMFEKYDARYCTGQRGFGGEYAIQDGFGWTNGSVLVLLSKYMRQFECANSSMSLSS